LNKSVAIDVVNRWSET